ncbi:bifunctional tRNA (5-methylaminomethyl-2-thiouridine)(34)-methyltransferase MnmD/FAD-dependent 5-carboxymethylaminomethyl-2-thiouridine(34) oxidoreductase MnmC [Thalassotalea sp. HSM 43]|uniref:bifunctional tRNA (5-methylaminomethyl-2-thiouridine)(34)-methyltransferase MnmD/FAD-dependent 5-carboxymethylaminomethyl-2-thiouridine(34) oxidoreductase MnmC n=1 Tax=Thalassotalea sp. HSM 43 TaxID=2552945 RepID=UPI0016756CEE|nr:bifunctional tRNA (5-methylaminomethyl-2-thiouridine)(34)-methyltransferase MnmD/FAD-dependent 5-carboxymethylaminomethyl-2-thiouridine(34) oxidoreductase MnmC [Thalassotalea sp. HSM 43]
MSDKATEIKTAKVKFDEFGAPYSDQFDDIYFDNKHGCLQSEQVFIENNGLPDRWHQFDGKSFVIAETGFGTGLNFLITAAKFTEFKANTKSDLQLNFITVEKFPLSKDDLCQALKLWPQFSDISNLLLRDYQLEQSQLNIRFANDITLTIYFADALQSYRTLADDNGAMIDAFFLDGFAPRKNSDMWSETLFAEFARLAKPDATLGTFTVAGFVRRGLEDAGFKVSKRQHRNRLTNDVEQNPVKAESLMANYVGKDKAKPINGFKVRSKTEASQHATIIGGGLASACVAHALVSKGIRVTLYCKDEHLAQGASSNAIGAIYPLLHVQRDNISDFYQQAFDFAMPFYQQLLDKGYQFSHGFDGLLEVAYKEPLIKRQQKFAEQQSWPEDLIRSVSPTQASELSNISLEYGGLFMERAGWVCPPELVNAISKAAIDTGLLTIKYNRHLKHVKQADSGRWHITTNKESKTVQNLIFCIGADSLNIDILNDLPLTAVRGQVSQMRSNEVIKPLKTVLCHKGYVTPEHNGSHCIGATFDKHSVEQTPNRHDDIFNLTTLNSCLGEFHRWQQADVVASKARLRCCTPDHLPMAGRMPIMERHIDAYDHLRYDKNWFFDTPAPLKSGLYVLTGLGARGLCSAPLLADIIAAEISNSDYPVDNDMLFNLSPNRFIVRNLIRGDV